MKFSLLILYQFSFGDALKCINCHALVRSDGFLQGHVGDGSACFNGSETNEVQHEHENGGQCKTVYINEWGNDWGSFRMNQSDLKRIWTHEVGNSFDGSKVYSWGHYWKDCRIESCDGFKANWADEFINDANDMIQSNIKSKKVIESQRQDSSCHTCQAFSFDPNDTKLIECMNGNGDGESKSCKDNEQCLTYFNIQNMSPPGIGETYQVTHSCQNPGMVNVRQYQEHHYCNSTNCNAHVMLGDGAGSSNPDSGNNGGDNSSSSAINTLAISFQLIVGFGIFNNVF